MNKYLPLFLLIFFYSLLSCTEGSRRRLTLDERRRDRRGDFFTEEARARELRRLRGSQAFIQSDLDNKFKGGIDYDDYLDGSKCEESDDCKRICETQLKRKYKNKCYRAPEVVVDYLEEILYDLINIAEIDSVDIRPGLLAGILKINENIIIDLIEDNMSVGDIKSFLAWVAINKHISSVFLEESVQVIETAFKKLGELQIDEVRHYVHSGLNIGLIQKADSFFYLASFERNIIGFQIAYQIMEEECNQNTDCKLDVLCAREEPAYNRRSRIFRPSVHERFPFNRRSLSGSSLLSSRRDHSTRGAYARDYSRDYSSRSSLSEDERFRPGGFSNQCRTATEQNRRIRRDTLCYIHGGEVWSYVDLLIEEEDIDDIDFKGTENAITVEKCNDHCGTDREDSTCQAIK